MICSFENLHPAAGHLINSRVRGKVRERTSRVSSMTSSNMDSGSDMRRLLLAEDVVARRIKATIQFERLVGGRSPRCRASSSGLVTRSKSSFLMNAINVRNLRAKSKERLTSNHSPLGTDMTYTPTSKFVQQGVKVLRVTDVASIHTSISNWEGPGKCCSSITRPLWTRKGKEVGP